MKKMIDELKKLDHEYDVPADFSKIVMAKIKAETKAAKKKNVIKYVVPSLSFAAMFLIAVIVSQNGNKSAESAASVMDSVNYNSMPISAGASSENEKFDNEIYTANKIELDKVKENMATSTMQDASQIETARIQNEELKKVESIPMFDLYGDGDNISTDASEQSTTLYAFLEINNIKYEIDESENYIINKNEISIEILKNVINNFFDKYELTTNDENYIIKKKNL